MAKQTNGRCFDVLAKSIENMSGSIRNVERDYLAARKIDADVARDVFVLYYMAHCMVSDRTVNTYHAMPWKDVVLCAKTALGKTGYVDPDKQKAGKDYQTKDEGRWYGAARTQCSRLTPDERTPLQKEAAKQKADTRKAAMDKAKDAEEAKKKEVLKAKVRKELDTVPAFTTYDDLLVFVANETAKLRQVIERNASAHGSHSDVFAMLRDASAILAKVPSPVIDHKVAKERKVRKAKIAQ